MNTLTAVFGIALLAALLYTALKRSVPSYALFLSLAAALVILVRVGAAFRSVLLGVARFLVNAHTEHQVCRTDIAFQVFGVRKNIGRTLIRGGQC